MISRMNKPKHIHNRKDTSERKMSKKKRDYNLLGIVLALFGIILSILFYFFKPPLSKPSIDEYKLDISYFASDKKPEGLVNLGEIKSVSEGRYIAYDEIGCIVTDIRIKNSNDEEGIVTSLTLHVEDIKQINEPYLTVDFELERSGQNNDYVGLTYYLINQGWMDATNVTVELGNTDALNSLFTGIPTLYLFDRIGVGERVKIVSILESKLIRPERPFTYQFILFINYNELSTDKITLNLFPIGNSSEGFIWPEGKNLGGYEPDTIYAIKIDANLASNSYSIQQPTSVKAGEFINFPIIFFANRSCEMTYYVEAIIDFGGNRIKKISTQKNNCSFLIMSNYGNIYSIDEILDIDDIQSPSIGNLYFSFPLNGLDKIF